MRARILRLIVIVWLVASPSLVAPDTDVPKSAGAAADPIGKHRPIVLHLPLSPLSAGIGAIQVFTDTVSGSAPVAVTAGPPFTVTLSANPTDLTVGATSALTASVVDQSGNPVDD